MKSRLLSTLLSFSVSLSVAAHASFAVQPKNFEAIYKAKYHGISVTATRKLETLEDGTQLFTFFADSWLADLKETSLFRWNEDHIIPIQYRYERSGLGRDREAIVDFDWKTNKVINNVERKPWQMDVPDLAMDKLSYQLQIQTDLINGKELLEYEIADGGRMKEFSFEVLGEEVIKTKAGRFETVVVRRIREGDSDRTTTMWMAKNWDYLVVRLQQKEDGSSYEIDLHKGVLDGKRVKGF